MMSQRRTSNVVPESSVVAARGQSYEAGHGAASDGTVAMFHSTHNLQIEGSTLSVAGRDVIHNHNHNVHYFYERPRDIWGILQSIPNFRQIYQDMMRKATAGTGMWLVKGDKFRLWLEPNGDIKVFWGSGIPGAGKTLLASIVIKHLETLYPGPDSKVCVCYIYFRYSDHAAMTLRTILEILVKQTLERHPGCHTLIKQTVVNTVSP
ncbi:hypothetical protein BKA70DRAFT_1516747 [Coprinopsis sp. MPI-PUGE-AT-0042]|nr:hypothetical protein BKA70DRAFT_1516747 [Coprinopsis sp. MPI-PUGE-AT-0042]